MLRLHDSASSGNAYKIRLLLTQLGNPFERVEYDIDRGATRTDEFLGTKNANGRVPVLELEDGRCLPESNAILSYLAEGTPFLPGARDDRGRWERAQVLQWMFFEQYSHEPNIATVRFWITHKVEMTPERVAALPGKRKLGGGGAGRDGQAPAPSRLLRRRALHDRGHRAVRVYARRRRGWLRPDALPVGSQLAQARRGSTASHP